MVKSVAAGVFGTKGDLAVSYVAIIINESKSDQPLNRFP